jgi:phosphoglycolate phosphatase-like HAD superfamily hydrolase
MIAVRERAGATLGTDVQVPTPNMVDSHHMEGRAAGRSSFSEHLGVLAPLARCLLHALFAMEGSTATASRQSTRITNSVQMRRQPMLPLPRVLLCDLDGTLIDTMPVLADLATDVMVGRYNIPRPLARELYLATCGLPFVQQLEDIFPGDPRNAEASSAFEASKPARCSMARMPTDTRAAVAELKSRGVRIVVSSNNGTENVETFARLSEFPFDLVLGFGNGLSKGRPHIELAEKSFGVGRREMLFIGDSLHDGEIATAADIPFVGLAGTFSKERFTLRFPGQPVVSRFSELIDLFPSSLAAAVG